MSEVVDPEPVIRERLAHLAIEHEPRIAELEQALASAEGSEKRRLSKDLRQAKRLYNKARRATRGQIVVW